ncbi:MAG: aminotransferase class I/II-fold pyridoxal phosphate-dependent enzyme [Hyphomicrobium sp.]|jgi:aspartate/methionine/tyrosine aminotransferase
MSQTYSLASLADGSILSPFSRLRALLDGVKPEVEKTIDLTLGEPREVMPAYIADKMREAEALFAKYPPARGSDDLRCSIAAWIGRRYGLDGVVDLATEIMPCNGSREGLFYAAFPAVGRKKIAGRPAILICNPYYQAYLGAALATGAEPIFLNATAKTGHLPDLDEIAANKDLLARTAAFFLCSPANPQGAVASRDYILRALDLARHHDFMLFLDECYSEIYSAVPPTGGLEVAAKTTDRFENLLVFNSLSKRSNLPGLRSGFCAGDARFMATLFEVRSLVGPQMPSPTQHVSAAVWADEAHVIATRAAYRTKFDVADGVLGTRFGYTRPAGGFFLWLDMSHLGNGELAALTLWKRFGVKVIPGAYLAQAGLDGTNPGTNYVRVALVQDSLQIREALERFVHVTA